MKKLLCTFFLAGLFAGNVYAQLNDYKYIVVPKKFEAFKNENQHQTTTLIKYLFEQQGFNSTYDDSLPEDLNNNRCLGLTTHLEDESSLFRTKVTLVLKDCQAREIFRTQEGSSKEKDFRESYSEAIRQAFQSIEMITYAYSPKATASEPVTLSFKNDVKLPVEKNPEPSVENTRKEDIAVLSQEATPERQSYKNLEPKPSDIKKEKTVVNALPEVKGVEAPDIWYAQAIPNGFQLVDSTPKVVLKLLRSSIANTYLAENETSHGFVYQKNGQWWYEYYSGGQLVAEQLNIKF